MKLTLPTSGSYIVAVSGGVDSVALLDMLAVKAKKKPADLQLVVAHFDHGIRPDSPIDRQLVQKLAREYGLPFVSAEGHLGSKASEAAARTARYDFLQKVQAETKSTAIITAHHHDDVLETAILNLLRGTGRKGLTSLTDRPGLLRPLLNVTKDEIITYAKAHHLQWHEDSTNADQAYRRNYVRRSIVAQMDASTRQRLGQIIAQQRELNTELDALLAAQLRTQLEGGRLERGWFTQLPHQVAREVMASYLRAQGIADFDTKTLERLVVAAKVARPGRRADIRQGNSLAIHQDYLALIGTER
jgi:tRNA(Ile)-lysidine synthetase-like protein